MHNRKNIFIFLIFILFFARASAQVASHVILISIDGLRPEMYQDKSWPTPNLQMLMKEGTYAKHLKSVFPSYTYPSHTAMISGALPARSGIYHNQPKGSHGEWFWFYDSVRVPTLWTAARAAGIKTAAIFWPATVHAPVDYLLPEIWDNAHPSDRLLEAKKYMTPGLLDDLEKNLFGKLDSTTLDDRYLTVDENAGRIAAYIFEKYKPGFLALHVFSVDDMEHEYGRENDSVRLAVAADDRAIGDVLEAVQKSGLKDSTAVIIVGDHGFSDINTLMRPNMLIKNIPAKFIASGGSAFLYKKATDKTDQEIIRTVTDSLNKLPKDKRKLFRIMDRKELDQLGADSAALLAVCGVPGVVFSGSLAPNKTANNGPGTFIQQNPLDGVFVPVHGGHHGYDPNMPVMYTGFIAAGAGIIKGNIIDELSEPDIAPLIAKLLGIVFKTPDGKLVEGILKN